MGRGERRGKRRKKKGKIYLPRMSVLSAIFLRSRGLMTRREDQHSETESARVDVPVIALKRSATKNNLYDPFFFPLSFFMRNERPRKCASGIDCRVPHMSMLYSTYVPHIGTQTLDTRMHISLGSTGTNPHHKK